MPAFDISALLQMMPAGPDRFYAQKSPQKLENEYAEAIDFNLIPLHPQAADVFGANKSFSLLLRPDNHVGFITTETSPDELRVRLNQFVGHS